MDPFMITWIIGGIACILIGYVAAISTDEIDMIGAGIAAGIGFPILAVIAVFAAAVALIHVPYWVARYFIEKKHKQELKFKNLDKELDKQIEETRKITDSL